MDWLHHPAYSPLHGAIIDAFRDEVYRFRRRPRKVVLLCGGSNFERRNHIRDFVGKLHHDVWVFYAEDVWTQLSLNTHRNALELEDRLASLSDLVIIVVESAGAIAELGAFSHALSLREKLLPILDSKHRFDQSFILTGPVRWVDHESRFRPAIFVDFKVILECGDELAERLSRLPRFGRIPSSVAEVGSSPKHLLLLLCDLAAVIGPAPAAHFEYFIQRILGSQPTDNISELLGLAVALHLLRNTDSAPRCFYRPLEDGKLEPYRHKRSFDLGRERARVLDALQRIPLAQDILRAAS